MNKKDLYHPKYQSHIDGLRAIAVLSVVLFHAFPNLLPGGFIGVDIFFVISGYLISTIIFTSLNQNTFDFLSFYIKRIVRIFPALIFVLVSCFIFGWFGLFAFEFKELGRHIFGGSIFVNNFMFWKEAGYFDRSSELKPLLHLWSLSIEEQFYIVWPFFIWIVYKYKFNLFLAIASVFLLSFVAHLSFIGSDSNAVFYQPQFRAWELSAGSLCAYLQLNLIKSSSSKLKYHKNLFAFFGLTLVSIGILVITNKFEYPGWWAALFPVLGSCLIIQAPKQSWINQKILSNKVMVWFGVISYPLYLWHWPILSLARVVEGNPLDYEVKVLLVGLSIFLAGLTYYFVEKPIRFGIRSKQKINYIIFLMIIVGSLGFIVNRHDGYGKRHVMDSLQNIEKFKDDFVDPEYRSKGWFCDNKNTHESHCIYDANHKPDIVLIGDSHSVPLYFGLKDIYLKQGKNLALYGGSNGCPPLLNLISGDSGTKSTCIDTTTNALQNILNDKTIKTVILMNRGPVYTSTKGYGDISAIKNWRIFDVTNDSEQSAYRIFAKALDLTLMKLEESNKKIIYIHNEPELGFDIRTCITSHPIRFGNSLGYRNPCALEKSKFLKRNLEHRMMVDSILVKHPTVKSIDLSEALCENNYCYGKNNDYLFYRDDNHLSVNGAKYVCDKLRSKFD